MNSILVLLLKTRSVPHDAYEEYFSNTKSSPAFRPVFVPVLDHSPHIENLQNLKETLSSGSVAAKYGGMIFTSQRAVEAWARVVGEVEHTLEQWKAEGGDMTTHPRTSQQQHIIYQFFPLYTVGPATARALATLLSSSPHTTGPSHLHSTLQILGSHTGNGAALASFIQTDYNALYAHAVYEFYEAPRLPFIPLTGSMTVPRMDRDDQRLAKKPLLFLVGEKRRDVIPKTLQGADGERRIEVEEVETYKTAVMKGYELALEETVSSLEAEGVALVAVVIFSPSGCDGILRRLGFLDEPGRVTEAAHKRWDDSQWSTTGEPGISRTSTKYIVAAIGPTTRDYLMDTFGFEADVCAKLPTPEAVGEGIATFIAEKKLVQP